MPEKNVKLYEFLLSEESASLKNVAIAERFGTSEASVRRARKDIAEGGSVDSAPVPKSSRVVVPTSSEPTELLPLRDLDLDAGTRVRTVDPETVDRYKDAYRETNDPGALGPLVAYDVEGFERPLLTQGYHRHAAQRDVFGPEASVPVIVREGTFHEALLGAMRDNREHGLPLSRQDRINILIRAFDEGWADWNDSRIAREVGEKDRALVKEVRTLWHRRKGTKDPGVRLAERNGLEYPMKVPVRPDRGPDQAEQDDVDLDGDEGAQDDAGGPTVAGETPEQRRYRIDSEYLSAIPCRSEIAPGALPAFDAQALAYRDGLVDTRARAINWCARHKPEPGAEPSPLYKFWEKAARFPVPVPLEKEAGWVVCRSCKDPETGLATGHMPGQNGTPCSTCRGYAFRIPGH